MKSWVRFFVLGVMSILFILSGCGGGGGDSSPVVPVVPGAPTGVTAVAGPGQARITWDNVAGATSYNLYYSATAGVTKATGTKISNVDEPIRCHPADQRRAVLFRGDGGQCRRRERGIRPGYRYANPRPCAPTSGECQRDGGHPLRRRSLGRRCQAQLLITCTIPQRRGSPRRREPKSPMLTAHSLSLR